MKNKKRSKKKIVSLIAVAAILTCLSTAFAAGGLGGWYSSHAAKIDSIEDSASVTEKLGFEPVLIETFENGYSYADGNIVDNSVTEEDGSVREEFKSAFLIYEKDGEEVWFSQDKSDSINVEKGELAATVDGIDLYYYSYNNKVVPEDYERTAEDIAAEESGELILSWGSDTVRQFVVQAVEWRSSGIAYMLMQTDGALTAEELLTMAKEAVAAF